MSHKLLSRIYCLQLVKLCGFLCVGPIYIFGQNWNADKKYHGISKMQHWWNRLWV